MCLQFVLRWRPLGSLQCKPFGVHEGLTCERRAPAEGGYRWRVGRADGLVSRAVGPAEVVVEVLETQIANRWAL